MLCVYVCVVYVCVVCVFVCVCLCVCVCGCGSNSSALKTELILGRLHVLVIYEAITFVYTVYIDCW